MSSHSHSPGPPPAPDSPLEARLCQVVGLNQNYISPSGTNYHIQIEDRGPVQDRLSGRKVRRVSVIVYANYGEPTARIIHGRDHDFEDVRTAEHNRFIEQKVQELATAARRLIGEKELGQIQRIKALLRRYYHTKEEAAKREFEQANRLYPFLFSRAWAELKQERAALSAPSASPSPRSGEVPAPAEPASREIHYPLDSERRERVLEIERLISELEGDLERLRSQGAARRTFLDSSRQSLREARTMLERGDSWPVDLKDLEALRSHLAASRRQVRAMLK